MSEQKYWWSIKKRRNDREWRILYGYDDGNEYYVGIII